MSFTMKKTDWWGHVYRVAIDENIRKPDQWNLNYRMKHLPGSVMMHHAYVFGFSVKSLRRQDYNDHSSAI